MVGPVKDCASSVHSHFFFCRGINLPRCTFPLLCLLKVKATFPLPGQQVWLLSSPPLYKWRPGAKRPACPLRQKCPIGQAYSQFLKFTHPPCPRLKSPRPPTLKCAPPPPQHQPPCRESCTMHNALQHLNPPSQQQWSARATSWAHRYSCRRAELWYLEESPACNVTLNHCTAHTQAVLQQHPSLPAFLSSP